ncbi:GroES-like protein [Hypoxylon trugodes]|uniref:GroES-like protein n=1 Tax=Hypoxylon trugodes TaxID=326681 RepID=UPI00218E45C4|nr:GroES-like protein [Hypoxylon trugodes]KAI1393294.1 GroES-like protein [Hypoxylon trugodes]
MSIQQFQTTKVGGPFALVTVPTPKPGSGEVSIRPKALALNGIDWKNLKFGAVVQSWPAVLGEDAAGIIEEVGEGVTAYKPGDEVFGFALGFLGKGTFQDVFVTTQESVAKRPANLTREEAASLPTIFLTATATLTAGLQIHVPGLTKENKYSASNPLQSILILGAGSGVGSVAIQLLRIALPSVNIITTSSAHHHAHLKALGANTTLDRSAQSDIAAIKAATPGGAGVDAILDPVGAADYEPTVLGAIRADGPKLFSRVVTGANSNVPEGFTGKACGAYHAEPTAVAYMAELAGSANFKLPLKLEVVGQGYGVIEKNLDRFPNISGTKLIVNL